MLQKDRKPTRGRTAPKKAARPATPPPAATSVTSAPATQPTAAAQPAPARRVVSPEERARMVAEAAYFRAQRRGFGNGDPARDWVEAEAEIDAMLLHVG